MTAPPANRLAGATMAHMPSRAPRFERIRVRPFSITPRDLEILSLTGRHGVVHSQQLDQVFSDGSPRGLRRRLHLLYHGGYLIRPRAQRHQPLMDQGPRPMLYALSRRGQRYLAEQGIEVPAAAADLTRASLTHAVAVTDFMLALEQACAARERLMLAEARAAGGSSKDYWSVEVLWQGKRRTLHPKPDRMFSILDGGGERKPKHFFLERDRGTMPVLRPTLEQTSILRKYLQYSATYEARLERELFGWPHFRVLFVVKSPARLASMLEGFDAHREALCSPKVFLFADWPSIRASGDVLAAPWYQADGTTVRLLD